MKVKRAILVTAILVGLLGLFATRSDAAPQWYFCTVNYVGVMAGAGGGINLTDAAASPAFANRWFVLDSTNQKQLLAVGLTAISNNSLVLVLVDPAELSIVQSLYLQK